ncbi:hypothetical protein PHSY_005496 [Pseudozyma hubeiensis SY62]|uniref:Uncharacterized protein n=1 Tax=Pseudozyma hubeiensis (strain SY62) TaxID=1305764 RepID=R9P949_PSEHS|nr:hypothetical protein PHSY_005496 [Pseudozyma hubeiensis SY62]GAC97908.1 hypothetical protein PHSY_005496 [Pseudozyma hubeiensis SY62]
MDEDAVCERGVDDAVSLGIQIAPVNASRRDSEFADDSPSNTDQPIRPRDQRRSCLNNRSIQQATRLPENVVPVR